MRTIFRRSLGFLALPLLCYAWPADAQDKADGDKPPGSWPVWQHEFGFDLQATATMLAAGDACSVGGTPFSPLTTRVLLGEENFLRTHWRFDYLERVPPLPADALFRIEDKRPLPASGIKDLDLQFKDPDFNWNKAFVYAVVHTHTTDEQRFKTSAHSYREVRFTDLQARPKQYRGKVLTVTGKLAVLRKENAPHESRRFVADLPHVYNGWIITHTTGAPPFVVAVTELPPEVEVSENLNAQVTFVGYFISLVKFPTGKTMGSTEKFQNCPYLVGKIIEVKESADKPATGAFSYYLIVSTLSGILVVAVVIMLINIWLRRNDARIQAKIAEVRYKNNPFNVEPADEAAPPETKPAPESPPDPTANEDAEKPKKPL
jgi:hypothetical protein